MKTIIILIIWNLITFAMYGIDKWRAIKGRWRISEKTLILSAFLMGGVGALTGMRVFHHKTKHNKFAILIPIAVVFNFAVILYLINRR